MRAVIVYESMYGNTRLLAEAIGRGLAPAEVILVPAAQAAGAHLTQVAWSWSAAPPTCTA